MAQNDKKFCLSHSISQEPYIIHSSNLSLKGDVNFEYLPWRGESEKLKKAGGSMVFSSNA